MIATSAGQVRLTTVLAAAALAASLEFLVRSLAPLPYAPRAEDLALSMLFYLVTLAIALRAGRFLQRLPGPAFLLTGAPFGLVVLNLLLGFGLASRMLLVAIAVDAGVWLGAVLLRLASPRELAGAALACLITGAGVRSPVGGNAAADAPVPSVLLVVLDTTTARHLSAYGYERATSPNLAILARRSVVYRRAISPAPWTIPAHASIFSGRYPSELGFDGLGFTAPAPGSIAADVACSGRRAVGISANPLVSSQTVLKAGFDGIWGARRLARTGLLRLMDVLVFREWHLTPGERVTDLALDWVDRLAPRGQPWFLFLNYTDPHAPYHPPRQDRERFAPGVDPGDVAPELDYASGRRQLTPEAITAMRALYDAEVAAMDREIGRLLEGLEKRGYDEKRLVLVVTADHGEALGEHGLVGHMRGLPDPVLHVPLLVSGPGVQPQEVTDPVQTVQIRATLRRLLGLCDSPDIALALPPWGPAPPLLITEHREVQFAPEARSRHDAASNGDPWRGNWVAAERGGTKAIFDDSGRGVAYRLTEDPDEMHPLPLGDAIGLVHEYEAWRRGLAARHALPIVQHRQLARGSEEYD